MIVVPYAPEHIRRIRPQPAQTHEVLLAAAPALEAGPAWSAFDGDECIAAAGLVALFPHRAYAWALLGADVGPRLVALTRAIRFRLDDSAFARVEMAVDSGFAEGVRWARLLGFTCETQRPLRAYLPGPRDAWLFARVK